MPRRTCSLSGATAFKAYASEQAACRPPARPVTWPLAGVVAGAGAMAGPHPGTLGPVHFWDPVLPPTEAKACEGIVVKRTAVPKSVIGRDLRVMALGSVAGPSPSVKVT